jgi:hypothetical protein
VLLPCVVGRLSRRGCMTLDWAWGTVGTCMGWAWLGAWVWGTVATCPAWSGPGWCSGHWCGLATPRKAASGDVACLGLWGQLGCVLCPRTSGRGCCGLVCHVSCVVVPGAGCGGLLLWVWVLYDMAAQVGQRKHGGGAQTTHLTGLPLVGSPLLSVAPLLCPTCLTSLKSGERAVVTAPCRLVRSGPVKPREVTRISIKT